MYRLYKLLSYLNPKTKQEAKNAFAELDNAGILNFSIKEVREGDNIYYTAKFESIDKLIITSGEDLMELDKNIKDAILTAYKVPARYAELKTISSGLINEKSTLQYATR